MRQKLKEVDHTPDVCGGDAVPESEQEGGDLEHNDNGFILAIEPQSCDVVEPARVVYSPFDGYP